MAAFNTVPEEEPLVAKAIKTKRRLVTGAAVASIILGTLAATAISIKVRTTTSFKGTWSDYDPAHIIEGCSDKNQEKGDNYHVEYTDSGSAGAGWYCADNEVGKDFNEVACTKSSCQYEPAAIHSNCDRAAFHTHDKMWKCLDDNFEASDLGPNNLGYQVTKAASATYASSERDILDGGYFYYQHGFAGKSTDKLVWNYDNSDEEWYSYDYSDSNYPKAIKIWKDDGPNTGFYKIYNNCYDGPDGKKVCYLHFYCTKWDTDEPGDDC